MYNASLLSWELSAYLDIGFFFNALSLLVQLTPVYQKTKTIKDLFIFWYVLPLQRTIIYMS